MTSMLRTYSQLQTISNFEDRFDYLAIRSQIGLATFGFERHLNQSFYTSHQWRTVRHEVIARDEGCDLGVPGYEIYDKIIIHHMNPMTIADVDNGNPDILNPEYLIAVSHKTHNAIHFGDRSMLQERFIERRPGDTKTW